MEKVELQVRLMGTWPEWGPSTVATSVHWKKDLHLQKELPKAYAFFLCSLWPHQSALIYVSVHFHSAANFNLPFHVSLYMKLLCDLSSFLSPPAHPISSQPLYPRGRYPVGDRSYSIHPSGPMLKSCLEGLFWLLFSPGGCYKSTVLMLQKEWHKLAHKSDL